ncbi:MAG: hypothetical protein R6U96_16685 [Promethearchaeia archaeon]
MSEENEDDDEHKLKKIRMEKMKALMEKKKRQEARKSKDTSMYDKVEYVLKTVLSPKAYSHLNELKEEEPKVYQQVLNHLITPDVLSQIDYLVSIIQRRGGSIPRRIPLDAIIHLERKVKGIKGKVRVKRRDGDLMDLGSYLKK